MSETAPGRSRDRWRAVGFLAGLALIVAGSAAAGRLGGADVLVRLAGYALAVWAPLACVRDRV